MLIHCIDLLESAFCSSIYPFSFSLSRIYLFQLFFHPWFAPFFPSRPLDERFPATAGIFDVRGLASLPLDPLAIPIDSIGPSEIHPHCERGGMFACYSPDNMHVGNIASKPDGRLEKVSSFWSYCAVEDSGNVGRLSAHALANG